MVPAMKLWKLSLVAIALPALTACEPPAFLGCETVEFPFENIDWERQTEGYGTFFDKTTREVLGHSAQEDSERIWTETHCATVDGL